MCWHSRHYPPCVASQCSVAARTWAYTAVGVLLHHAPIMRQAGSAGSSMPRNAQLDRSVCAEAFWPHLAVIMEDAARDLLPDALNNSKPPWMGSLKLRR